MTKSDDDYTRDDFVTWYQENKSTVLDAYYDKHSEDIEKFALEQFVDEVPCDDDLPDWFAQNWGKHLSAYISFKGHIDKYQEFAESMYEKYLHYESSYDPYDEWVDMQLTENK